MIIETLQYIFGILIIRQHHEEAEMETSGVIRVSLLQVFWNGHKNVSADVYTQLFHHSLEFLFRTDM